MLHHRDPIGSKEKRGWKLELHKVKLQNGLLSSWRAQERTLKARREADKGREKAERKLDILLLRLGLINRKRQPTIL